MKKTVALVCLGFAVFASAPAFAGSQQEKMKGCNVEAKKMDIKGDERKAFMKKCLSKDYQLKADKATTAPAKATPATPATPAAQSNMPTQQDKMKACNADAKSRDLKGDERKMFISSCLKK